MSNIIKVIPKQPAAALQLTKANAKEVSVLAREVADVTSRAGGGWVHLFAPGWERKMTAGDWIVIQDGVLFVYSDSEFNETFKTVRSRSHDV